MNRGRGSIRGGGRSYASRGRSSHSSDHHVARYVPASSGSQSSGAASGSVSWEGGRRNWETTSVDGVPKEYDHLSPTDGKLKLVETAPAEELRTHFNLTSASPCYHNGCPSPSTPTEPNAMDPKIESYSMPHDDVTNEKKEKSDGTNARNELENSFDICEERNTRIVKLKTPLHVKNKAMRDEKKRQFQGDNIQVFRPGMILLKGYLSLGDQVKLVKACRDLGRGAGGFYQPGYRDGAKLHLKMMCLGKNWDPETCLYGEIRPVDHARAPPIPNEFHQLVEGALQKCHSYLESDCKLRNAKQYLPSMSPNICIVNFYAQTGKLGLHQDKDESQESLQKRLPVVSISVGDSAEFLFGDQRDVDKADKVELESGDVLIFGGESRHIFHGVSSIKAGTAPNPLLEETKLKPGRLNLTFREY